MSDEIIIKRGDGHELHEIKELCKMSLELDRKMLHILGEILERLPAPKKMVLVFTPNK